MELRVGAVGAIGDKSGSSGAETGTKPAPMAYGAVLYHFKLEG